MDADIVNDGAAGVGVYPRQGEAAQARGCCSDPVIVVEGNALPMPLMVPEMTLVELVVEVL